MGKTTNPFSSTGKPLMDIDNQASYGYSNAHKMASTMNQVATPTRIPKAKNSIIRFDFLRMPGHGFSPVASQPRQLHSEQRYVR